MTGAAAIIGRLGLQPHPEGGWYRETWRGPEVDGRASGTAILFLLQAGECSHWHRVDADEIWLWHAGAPLVLSMGRDRAEDRILGPDVLGGQVPQAVVPAGWWQAARLAPPFVPPFAPPLAAPFVPPPAAPSAVDYALVSCTVSPGFRFQGFELAAPGWSLPAL